MYQPYQRYHGNGYQNNHQQYQQDYPEYAPVPHQAQGPPAQYQQTSNPFIAPLAAAPLPLAQPNVQRKNKKKKRQPSTSAAPVVPQPKGIMTPALAVPLVPSQSTTTPPGHKWVLLAENAPNPTQPASPEVKIVEQDPVKVNAGLKQAQADLDKMQSIIESALICLIEPRQGYQLSQFGILEAYVPACRIEVLTGA